MPSWYRSLYWRVAITFVLCLAAMLVVQGVLFVWVISRAGPTLPGQSPARFGQTVALDIADALERDPSLDVPAFVKEQFGSDAHPFFVMTADGRMVSNDGPFPHQLIRQARNVLQRARERGRPGFPPFGRGNFPPPGATGRDGVPPPPGGQPPERGGPPPVFDRFGRGGQPADAFRAAARPIPVVVRGEVEAVVVVPPVAPFRFLLRRYAPTLTIVAGGALGIGALLAAVAVFGPTRRRLRGVEQAARKLGAGDLQARAPSEGGDEVAAVAVAFNAMADALAVSDRSRRQLLADVSHELTTPVTAMRGYLETLTMPELALNDATRERYLGIMSDETRRLEHIIGDLLDLARLEGGGGAWAMDRVSVDSLFARVVARHERTAQEADVRIATTVGPGAESVYGDQDRLEQALQNLAANALRYAPDGSTIALESTLAPDGAITLTTTDEGPGIPTEHLPHIFERFYKADAARAARGRREGQPGTPSGGSGLGLSIVKVIAERHFGRVSVTSRPGRTVFTIAGLKRDAV